MNISQFLFVQPYDLRSREQIVETRKFDRWTGIETYRNQQCMEVARGRNREHMAIERRFEKTYALRVAVHLTHQFDERHPLHANCLSRENCAVVRCRRLQREVQRCDSEQARAMRSCSASKTTKARESKKEISECPYVLGRREEAEDKDAEFKF